MVDPVSPLTKPRYAKCFWCQRLDGRRLRVRIGTKEDADDQASGGTRVSAEFNLASDQEVARHAWISVNAIAELAGRYHWLCTYAIEEKLFSVIAVDDESTYAEWVKNTNAYTVGLKIRRIVRVLDPSLAE
jgi:hypothetical protein